jgi:hypothetical protein
MTLPPQTNGDQVDHPSGPCGPSPTLRLGRLDRVDPRVIWAHEAHHFTPWLLSNSERLAEALGIELELEQAEHPVGNFSLDLVGRDMANGTVVIVENQLEASDHTHLGQVLTYAAGTSADTIVWLTTNFRDEHRQALTWLNERTDEGTHFFGVELQVVRIGDSDPAPVFSVVVQPNEWQKAVKAASAAKSGGGRGALYVEFWQKYLERARAEQPDWTHGKASTQSWLWAAAPIRTCGLSPAFAASGRIRYELYVDGTTSEQATGRYEALEQQKEALEQAYGRGLTWETLPGRRAYRIADYRPGSITEPDDWSNYMEFFLDAGLRMRRAMSAVKLPD